jgi:muramidase (phage lysozyme)
MALYQFNPTQTEQSILGQIKNEQALGYYNALYGFGRFTEFATFPSWPGVALQNGSMTHAAGAYQFEPATWAECQTATEVPDFSPASQDVAALWLLRNYTQVSQWGTTFQDDGWIYGFAAQGPFA